MYEEKVRPLSDEEREQLRATIGGIIPMKPVQVIGKMFGWLFALGACGTGFALVFNFVPSRPVAGAVGLLMVLGAIACLAGFGKTVGTLIALQDLEQQFKRREAPEVEAALRDGRARVQQVEAAAVVELTLEEDDEGSIYAFDVGDDRTLVVDTADWPPPDGSWPNSHFGLVRTVHGDRVVAIHCLGRLLRPLRTIRFEDCDEEFGWGDEIAPLLNQSLEEFVRATRA